MANRSIPPRPFNFNIQRKVARFWASIDITANPDECWEWTGCYHSSGYGSVYFARAVYRTHRLAWLLANHVNSTDLHILHLCDNPPCCNPNHLRAGTQLENIQEALIKHRMIGQTTLSDDQVRQIRLRFASGAETKRGLAREFKCSPTTIHDIVDWRTRRYVI